MTASLPVGTISLMAYLAAYGDDESNDTNASADNQNSEAVEALIQKALDNMVFVEGFRENTIHCAIKSPEKL